MVLEWKLPLSLSLNGQGGWMLVGPVGLCLGYPYCLGEGGSVVKSGQILLQFGHHFIGTLGHHCTRSLWDSKRVAFLILRLIGIGV